ncbi:hypothetical protein B7494_g2581 [Chlorociboria aeruginascens]|nr:hypothetical protein B7494_g2581 [Chlorociboria aeruginascens]
MQTTSEFHKSLNKTPKIKQLLQQRDICFISWLTTQPIEYRKKHWDEHVHAGAKELRGWRFAIEAGPRTEEDMREKRVERVVSESLKARDERERVETQMLLSEMEESAASCEGDGMEWV